MNKKIVKYSVLTISLIAILTIAVFAINYIKAQEEVKEITLKIKKRFAFYYEIERNVSSAQYTFTITEITGFVKIIKLSVIHLPNPRIESFSWIKANPSVGDSVVVELPQGNYLLLITIAGKANSTLKLVIATS